MNILLVGSGKISDYKSIKNKLLDDYDYIVAIDGGANHLIEIGIKPTIILGDLDSINSTSFEIFKDVQIKKYPKEKDFSDSELAFELVEAFSPAIIHAIGLFGGRLDHSLSNLNLLVKYKHLNILMFDEKNEIMYCKKKMSIKKKKGYYLSLIPLNNIIGLTIKNVKYPLDNRQIIWPSSLMLSNEIIGEFALIEYEKGDIILMNTKD